MTSSTPLASIIFLWVLAAQATKPSKRCPKGCQCQRGDGGGMCGVEVQCRGLKVFPQAEQYPKQTDCLFIHSPRLGKLTAAEKEAGLNQIPNTIRRLDLSESRLGELPEAGLGHLSELRVLNLEFNNLVSLPKKTFHGLRKLKVLWLTGNHYGEGEPVFKRMQKAGNRINELHPEQFHTLEHLQVLLVHHNELKKLPDGIFDGLRNLRVLKLLDNPFKPRLKKKHHAFRKLLSKGVLNQLDLDEDSGDDLEDQMEEQGTYLSDDPVDVDSAPDEL